MIGEKIRIAPFEVERIIQCKITKKVNDHGRAYVKGYIPWEKETEYLLLASQGLTVQIEAVGEDESAVIFSGIIEDCRIRNSNHVLTMELTLVTHTYLMDLNPLIRSFQVPSMPYQQIFDTITCAYEDGGCIMAEGQAAVAGDLIVQYRETDWEFFKRIASHLNTVIIPSFKTAGPKYYVGLPQWTGITTVNPYSYESCKLVKDYLFKRQNQVEGLIEDDELCYLIQEQKILDLGDQVEFQGQFYYVAEVKSHLDGHQLWNSYMIKPKAGFQVPRVNNERIVGASVDGVVTGVSGAQVKVSLRPDAAVGDTKWFPFSTVYSSPNGSGWYCMPEIGDEIRLYFPTVKEKHAYVISAVHLPVAAGAAGASAAAAGGGGGCRCDPNKKTIMTETKTIMLDETQILLSSNNGDMSILLDDASGIVINCSKGVTINSSQNITLTGSSGIELIGTEAVSLKAGTGVITIEDSMVTFAGAEVKLQ